MVVNTQNNLKYWQDNHPVTLNEAMRQSLKMSSMITVLSAIVLEQVIDGRKLRGNNKFVLIGATLYLSNVLQYYMQMNGY